MFPGKSLDVTWGRGLTVPTSPYATSNLEPQGKSKTFFASLLFDLVKLINNFLQFDVTFFTCFQNNSYYKFGGYGHTFEIYNKYYSRHFFNKKLLHSQSRNFFQLKVFVVMQSKNIISSSMFPAANHLKQFVFIRLKE